MSIVEPDWSMMMHKISLIFSGILFLLGWMTLGIAIFFSDVSSKIFEIYMMTHPASSIYSLAMLQVNPTKFYILAAAELILGAVGYFFHRKKVD